MLRFPTLLMHKLRLSNPWRYKVPFLIAMPYWVMILSDLPATHMLLGFAMSCCTILGIAGFGYLLNDYTDREEDRAAGKPNVLIGMAPAPILALLIFLLGMAILPWVFYFPLDRYSILLLIAEFTLFILYSAPPFRLKERGILGLLADALYAHTVPAILATYTFYLLGAQAYTACLPFTIVLGTWQFCWGVRNILLHQIGDYTKDQHTGTHTFATRVGLPATHTTLKITLALETLTFFAFLATLATVWWPFPLFYLLFLAQLYTFRVRIWQIGLPTQLTALPSPLLDDFYCGWIPVTILGWGAFHQPACLILLAVHLLLFPNGLIPLLRNTWNILAPRLRAKLRP